MSQSPKEIKVRRLEKSIIPKLIAAESFIDLKKEGLKSYYITATNVFVKLLTF